MREWWRKDWYIYLMGMLNSHENNIYKEFFFILFMRNFRYTSGFRKGRGTRDQIANIRWIIEEAGDSKKKNIYFSFIDYVKDFDCVDHKKVRKILKEMGISDHLTCLLRNLSVDQEAIVRIRQGTMGWFKIRRVLPQGCILSPCLSNLYAE